MSGRPAFLDRNATKRRITEIYGRGGTLTIAAGVVGIGLDTIANWRKADPIFEEGLIRARASKADAYLEQLDSAEMRDGKQMRWWLAMQFPEQFASQRKVELTGANGGPIQVASMAAIIIGDASVGAAYDQLLGALARTNRDGEPGGIALGRNAQEPHTVEAVPPSRGPRSRTAKSSRRKD